MAPPLDIFKQHTNGTVLWRGAFSDMEAAQAAIQKLLVSDPGEYFIFNRDTEQKLSFKA